MAFGRSDWERLIHRLATDSARIMWTEHAKQQMRRRGITMAVVLDVLCHGVINQAPEPDLHTGHTKCSVERFCAGKPVCVVVALEHESTNACIVVTTFFIGE